MKLFVKKWQNAQRLIKPYPVLIPYIELIKFPNKPLRVRRDRGRFLTIIETCAFINQYQRKKKILNGKEYIVATTEDSFIRTSGSRAFPNPPSGFW